MNTFTDEATSPLGPPLLPLRMLIFPCVNVLAGYPVEINLFFHHWYQVLKCWADLKKQVGYSPSHPSLTPSH